jgi:preprotein translocase subunit YajC
MHLNPFLAQAATAPTTSTVAPGSPSSGPAQAPTGTELFVHQLPFFVLIAIVFYFMLIRPQQQRAKALAKLVNSMKAGDRVETASGIRGLVISVKDNTVTLKSIDSKIEVSKASVTQILESGTSTEIKPS